MKIKSISPTGEQVYEAQVVGDSIVYFDEDNNRISLIIKPDCIEVIKRGSMNYHVFHAPNRTWEMDIKVQLNGQVFSDCAKILTTSLDINREHIEVHFIRNDEEEITQIWEFL